MPDANGNQAAPSDMIDPNVKLSPGTQRTIDLANAIHKQAYEVQPEPVVEPVVEPVAEPQAQPIVEPAPKPAPTVQAEPVETLNAPPPGAPDNWEQLYGSMRGRHAQDQKTIRSMQDQMSQIGDELIQTQNLLARFQSGQQVAQNTAPQLVTEKDIADYGADFIDLAKRAAKEAIQPELTALQNENATLKQSLKQNSRSTLMAMLDTDVPQWREINQNPLFMQWLNLPDLYSGTLRKTLFDAAIQRAQAPRVVAFYRGFLSENPMPDEPAPTQGQQGQPSPAPRKPAAKTLESLAAPGRARPASADALPVDKLVYTHKQIDDFYKDVQRGKYRGRQAEKDRLENDIFAAQREGRVRQ